MKYGVFLPVGNNGWVISRTAPQYAPSFDLNRRVVEKAEELGFSFALAMLKYRGFGGATRHWDDTADPTALIAALCAVTSKIKLYSTISPLTVNPVVAAKTAATLDDVSGGRFGFNLVAGWNRTEYAQMGAWPGEEYYTDRYEVLSEFTHIMKTLWRDGHATFHGEHFTIEDARIGPKPTGHIDLVSAGSSPRGRQFVAEYADYHFGAGSTPEAVCASNAGLAAACAAGDRRPTAIANATVVIADTDEDAARVVARYVEGADEDALAAMVAEYSRDTATNGSSAAVAGRHRAQVNPFYGAQPLAGSAATIAARLNALAAVPGTSGIMLTFDDFVDGMERFGRDVIPLLDHPLTLTDDTQNALLP
ncbi:LLM class flavin-dependent oxidoreductase [Rhodococcus sp. NPDC060084]|uniref:LLM class flavin-dependent oxidoreductase n=1 Tax=Rhodococcus sp. NPDC060084 TaxID=3347053 RepID=UPI003661D829